MNTPLTLIQKENLQEAILVLLAAAEPDGLHRDSLLSHARTATSLQRLTEDDFRAELDYLETKGLVYRAHKIISQARVLFRLTEGGHEYLDRKGLI